MIGSKIQVRVKEQATLVFKKLAGPFYEPERIR